MPVQEPDLTQLRHILYARKQSSGLTYDQLAEESGVSRVTLLNVASGKYNGDLKTWMKLSKVFGVSMDDMLAPVWAVEREVRSVD